MAEQDKSLDDNPKTEAIRRYIDEQVNDKFLKQYGASGCGIGRDANGEPCLNLYIEKRRPQVEKIVHAKSIPIEHGGKRFDVPIREIPVGELRLDKGAPNGALHVAGGEGIGANESGTLGGWAWDKVHHRLVFLSAFHVLGGRPQIVMWVPPIAPDAPPTQRFGMTIRGQNSLDGKPKVDCAIGHAEHPNGAVLEVIGLGAAIMDIGKVRDGASVVKVGSASDRTHGTISDPEFKGNFPLQATVGPPTTRSFANCFLIEPTDKARGWAKQGDSGSLVLSAAPNDRRVREVIGLHIATLGEGEEEQGIACRIENVFKALSITTLPEGVLAATVASAVGAGEEGEDMINVLSAFRDLCATSDAGSRVLGVIEKNRNALVTLLATSADLRNGAAAMLKSVFANSDANGNVTAEGVDVVMTRSMSVATVEHIRDFGKTLAAAATDLQQQLDGGEEPRPDGRDLRAAVEACLNDLPQAPDPTLDAILQPDRLATVAAHGL